MATEYDLSVFPEALQRAARRAADDGETTWLTRNGQRVVAIVPVPEQDHDHERETP